MDRLPIESMTSMGGCNQMQPIQSTVSFSSGGLPFRWAMGYNGHSHVSCYGFQFSKMAEQEAPALSLCRNPSRFCFLEQIPKLACLSCRQSHLQCDVRDAQVDWTLPSNSKY